jgi:hypothetical protein
MAWPFFPIPSAKLIAWRLCGSFSLKIKLSRLENLTGDFHFTGVEPPKMIPRVSDQCQSGRVAVAAAVKVALGEATAAAAPQEHNVVPVELSEERRKDRSDQGREVGGRSGEGVVAASTAKATRPVSESSRA